MSTITIPWNDGSGQSLEVTFSGTGNGTISLSSPRNVTGYQRTLQLTISAVNSSVPACIVTVTQTSGERFITVDGQQFMDSDNKDFYVDGVLTSPA